MLENIKLILGLKKNDYDNIITLYINKVTKRVKGYCNIENLDEIEEKEKDALNEFIEDKVSNIMAYKLSQLGENVDDSSTVTPANQGAIKSITRGSVRIPSNTAFVLGPTFITCLAAKIPPKKERMVATTPVFNEISKGLQSSPLINSINSSIVPPFFL